MTVSELLQRRLSSQLLQPKRLGTAQDAVRHMGAMQAQDYAMAKWAIGIRSGEDESFISQAIDSGKILRTHVLRPTWHLVAAEDIHWMLELTAPHLLGPLYSSSKKMGLDMALLRKATSIIRKLLSNHQYMTREEIMTALQKHHIPTDGLKPSHIMMHAEVERVVCSGPMRGKNFTYALMEERIGTTPAFAKEEALADLALRYFKSRGPATTADFSWWSGLNVTNSRLAVALIKNKLESVTIDGQVYLFSPESDPVGLKSLHLLPAFDEFLISYKDRTAAIEVAHQPKAFTRNGLFNPVILINGKAEGVWKRTFNKNKVVFDFQPFQHIDEEKMMEIITAAGRYALFTGYEAEFKL